VTLPVIEVGESGSREVGKLTDASAPTRHAELVEASRSG
jgi:hypothetical protein